MNARGIRALLLAGLIGAASATSGAVAPAAQPPNCQASDVTLTSKLQYMTRLSYGYVDISAKPGVVCTLSGYATKYRLFDKAGNRVDNGAERGNQQPELVTLTEDSPAHIMLAWDNFYAEVLPATMRLRLPGANASNTVPWPSEEGYSSGMFDGSFGHGLVTPGPSPGVW